MARTERIEARVDPEKAERIRHAASLADASVSAFIVDAAAERAERVIAESTETFVPADFFDSVLGALDEGIPSQALKRAGARARTTVKRR